MTRNESAMLAAEEASPLGDGAGLAIVTEGVDCGGTERVLQALADRFPAATIVSNHFPAVMSPDPNAAPWSVGARLVPSGRRKRHFLAPLYARRLAAAPVGSARLVVALAGGGGWALAAPIPPGARLLCYSAGLPGALYGKTSLYLRAERLPLRPLLLAAVPALRSYFQRLMRRPHRLVTNSCASATAIARVYGRQAEVVHPPVRTAFFTPAPVPKRHFLAVARMVPHKRFDILIDAFRGLDETLVIVGRGPWLERFRAGAPPNVRFTGWVDDATLRELYRSSHALACPSVEEFGIVMAEAHACGVPVIAPRAGAAVEIVDDPATGTLLETIDARSLAEAVRSTRGRRFDPGACRTSAERFAEEEFLVRMEAIIAEELGEAVASEGNQPVPVARAASI